MSDRHHQVLVGALLGWDAGTGVGRLGAAMSSMKADTPNAGDPVKLLDLYNNSAEFHAAIDSLALMLPPMVSGLAEAARRVAEQRHGELEQLLTDVLPPPHLRLFIDGGGDESEEHDVDVETCPDCGESTLLPDDHKCPNPECPSHGIVRRMYEQARRDADDPQWGEDGH